MGSAPLALPAALAVLAAAYLLLRLCAACAARHRSRAARARVTHPAGSRRPVPALECDGEPLDGAEQAALDEVQWDSEWIGVPEPRYGRND